jgi:hypothetical protein
VRFADPVCLGQIEAGEDWMAILGSRARTVALHTRQPLDEVRTTLGAEYMRLRAPPADAEPVLWFEHDWWDQAALLRVLTLLPRGRALAAMPADGVHPFALLPDDAFAALRAAPISEAMREAAEAAWEAYAAPDPRPLHALAQTPLPLPHLGAALQRHLRDLPWASDGLALSERQLLRAAASGARGDAALMAAQNAEDGVFPLTDLMVRELRERLASGGRRLLDASGAPTPHGEAVLAHRERATPRPRFSGGARAQDWRWDEDAARIVPA